MCKMMNGPDWSREVCIVTLCDHHSPGRPVFSQENLLLPLIIQSHSNSLRPHLEFYWQRNRSGLLFPSHVHLSDEETEANKVK